MVYGLFINLAIIVAFVFLEWQFMLKMRKSNKSMEWIKIFIGLASGVGGTLLMIYSINISHKILLDLRHIVIALSAIYGSPISAIICGIIIGTMRLILFGVSSSSIITFLGTIFVGVVFGYLGAIKKSNVYKFILMNLITAIYMFLSLYFVFGINQTLFNMYGCFIVISIIGGFLSYYVCEYVRISHENYKQLAYYGLIINNSSDLICIHGPNSKIKYTSPSINSLLGYNPDELIGSYAYDFLHPDDIEYIISQHQLVLEKADTITSAYRYKKKDGTYIWFESKVHAVKDVDGTIKELISISRDVTYRKEMEEKLKKANEELREKNKKLTELSFSDGLTGIGNRRFFMISLEKEFKRARRTFNPITLLMIDVDYFKAFNDTYGHIQGDECLKTIATTLNKNISRGADLVARLGGEEFAVLLPNTDEEGGKIVANKLIQAIENLRIPNENSKVIPYVTISIGICSLLPNISSAPEDLFHKADMALYNAKERGRNKSVVYVKQLVPKNIINEDLELWKKIEGIPADR